MKSNHGLMKIVVEYNDEKESVDIDVKISRMMEGLMNEVDGKEIVVEHMYKIEEIIGNMLGELENKLPEEEK